MITRQKGNPIVLFLLLLLLLPMIALGQPKEQPAPERPLMAEKVAITGQSGWYAKPSVDYAVDYCNVLVDSVGPAWACLYRVSAMCTQRGQGYTASASDYAGPIRLPAILGLYQLPSLVPTGWIEIDALGASPVIGFNSAPVPWIQSVAYQGGSCADIVQPPPVQTSPHYARLCRDFGLYCGQ